MNRTKIKNYAPQARRDFLQAVRDRAASYGLTADRIEPVTAQGDVAIIGGRAFPREVGTKRKFLQKRVERDGYVPTMEALAYTWFNRLVAIRYMELHGYFEHGYRVLSNPDPARATPEILDQAEHVELPDLDRERVVELKLEGTKEAELYRMLLVAQCNALHSAMPFLFERIGDETELVLPESLLHSDSIVRKLVSGINEEDWQEVEVIGWLYQFYISEKKDAVIGKVVASEDIPAATQLFTPNWIVKYLVQNTLGRQWLATYPQSPLRQQMEYYIKSAEQAPEVQNQLNVITPTSLNPEEITFLDPACGSAHILVEAYNLFKAIYQERGYRAKDIPALILSKNLFGLEIDERAAQLASFALMMKARADDRRIFDGKAKPNILAFQDSRGMDAAELTHVLNSSINEEGLPKEYLFEEIQDEEDGLFSKKRMAERDHVSQDDIAHLLKLFENATTFGSLIQIPPKLIAKLPEMEKRLDDKLKRGDLTHASAHVLKPLLQQAGLLARQYDAVAANPPFLDSKYHNSLVKKSLRAAYREHSKNLFSCFLMQILDLTKSGSHLSLLTPFVWLFIDSYEKLRRQILHEASVVCMVKPSYTAFFDMATVQFIAFTLRKTSSEMRGSFVDLGYLGSPESQPSRLLQAVQHEDEVSTHYCSPSDFRGLPGCVFAFWVGSAVRSAFANEPLSNYAAVKIGMRTGDNERFTRRWHEVSFAQLGFGFGNALDAQSSGKKWFPYNKGGDFRKWFGNNEFVVNWENDGLDIKAATKLSYPELGDDLGWKISNEQYYFISTITWSKISSYSFGARECDAGYLFDTGGCCLFPGQENFHILLGVLCSKLTPLFMQALNPSVNMQVGNVGALPVPMERLLVDAEELEGLVRLAVSIARADWDYSETSWAFDSLWSFTSQPLTTVPNSLSEWIEACNTAVSRMKTTEERINEILLRAYELELHITPEVPPEHVTLYKPTSESENQRLVSYAVGCTMGRYSLDTPGLVYAHGGNLGFDPGQYKTFPADPDGIVPVMEADWFADDAANRLVEFLSVAWPKEGLDENLKFVADALGPSRAEQPRATIRRYLATGFYKHHLQTYKRRPIYWLFSSGKQRAFQCLVYLHRYHEGTLARMRTEYVIPLQGKLASRIDQLAGEIPRASSTSHRNTLTKERDKLIKQQAELQAYDEKLRHFADMRIALDLDDGVKVNYGKFGDLLAEVKAVTGGNNDE